MRTQVLTAEAAGDTKDKVTLKAFLLGTCSSPKHAYSSGVTKTSKRGKKRDEVSAMAMHAGYC